MTRRGKSDRMVLKISAHYTVCMASPGADTEPTARDLSEELDADGLHTMNVTHSAPAALLSKEALRKLYASIAQQMGWELLSLQMEVSAAQALETLGQAHLVKPEPREPAQVLSFTERRQADRRTPDTARGLD